MVYVTVFLSREGLQAFIWSGINSSNHPKRNIHSVISVGYDRHVLTVDRTLLWTRQPQVMVKGEGLRVVKHNRSGGSQMRIIRYDPEIKALVWNSKRYMKKGAVFLFSLMAKHIESICFQSFNGVSQLGFFKEWSAVFRFSPE